MSRESGLSVFTLFGTGIISHHTTKAFLFKALYGYEPRPLKDWILQNSNVPVAVGFLQEMQSILTILKDNLSLLQIE
jgi:hypothetical protein